MGRILVFALACILTGCAGTPPPPAQLEPPSPRLMRKTEPLPQVQAGDDLFASNAQCRAEYGRESGRLTALQTYVRVVTKKRSAP